MEVHEEGELRLSVGAQAPFLGSASACGLRLGQAHRGYVGWEEVDVHQTRFAIKDDLLRRLGCHVRHIDKNALLGELGVGVQPPGGEVLLDHGSGCDIVAGALPDPGTGGRHLEHAADPPLGETVSLVGQSPTRDRLLVLLFPTSPSLVNEPLLVAERTPHGHAQELLILLPESLGAHLGHAHVGSESHREAHPE